MDGSLELHQGILYVGRQAKTAWISSYDLGGRPLETCFSFRDETVGRSSASGLALDADHRLWVADQSAGCVRAFTLFGQEVVTMGDPSQSDEQEGRESEPPNGGGNGGRRADDRGVLGSPVDVLTMGVDDELIVIVASAGRRRHGLQMFRASQARVRSLRPLGDPRGKFAGLSGLARRDEWLFAAEARAGRIQVFRAGEFHYSLPVLSGSGQPAEPVALDVLEDGRLVVAVQAPENALLLLSPTGRVERVLAEEGTRSGQVSALGDVAVEGPSPAGGEGSIRVFALDQDGMRVQVFTPQGRCYGSFPRLMGS